MSRYLPFGKPIQISDAEYNKILKLRKELDRYGIPYGVFDGKSEDEMTRKDLDRTRAIKILSEGKTLPKELATRLLKYKEDEAKKKSPK